MYWRQHTTIMSLDQRVHVYHTYSYWYLKIEPVLFPIIHVLCFTHFVRGQLVFTGYIHRAGCFDWGAHARKHNRKKDSGPLLRRRASSVDAFLTSSPGSSFPEASTSQFKKASLMIAWWTPPFFLMVFSSVSRSCSLKRSTTLQSEHQTMEAVVRRGGGGDKGNCQVLNWTRKGQGRAGVLSIWKKTIRHWRRE